MLRRNALNRKGWYQLGWILLFHLFLLPSLPLQERGKPGEGRVCQIGDSALCSASIEYHAVDSALCALCDSPFTLYCHFFKPVSHTMLQTPWDWEPCYWFPYQSSSGAGIVGFQNCLLCPIKQQEYVSKIHPSLKVLWYSPVHTVATWWVFSKYVQLSHSFSGKCWSTLRIWSGAM